MAQWGMGANAGYAHEHVRPERSELEHEPFAIRGGRRSALLLHGFLGSPATLRRMAVCLAADGWTVDVPLLPGFGGDLESLESRCWTEWLDAARERWIALREEADSTLLVGFSMGGALATVLAAEQKPDRLALAAPFWRIADWRAPFLPVLQHAMRHVHPFRSLDLANPEIRARVERLMPGLDLDDEAMRAAIQNDFRLPTRAVAQLRRVGSVAYAKASEVTCPTLVVQGLADEIVLASDTRALLARFGGPVSLHEFHADHGLVRGDDASFGSVMTCLRHYLTLENSLAAP